MQMLPIRRQHRVHKQAVSARGRYASSRGVRASNKPQHFQIGHDIANGGGREFNAGGSGKGARSDGLPVGYIAFNQCFQEQFGAIV